jgi:Zn-dependent protease with chaperone function
MKTVKLGLMVIFLIIVIPMKGQEPVRDREREAKIEKQLETLNAEVVGIFKKATIALDENNLELADSLYTIVYEKVPTFDPVVRRLGVVKAGLGELEEGIELGEKAIQIDHSVFNLVSLASIYMYSDKSSHLRDAQILLEEVISQPDGNELEYYTTYAQVSLQLEDIDKFKKAISLLHSKYPDDKFTHYFNSILMVYEEEWKDAKKEILLAKDRGLEPEIVDEFLNSGINSEIHKQNAILYFGILIGVWILGLLLLFIIGKLFSNLTLRAIENNNLDTSSAKPGGWLRSGYKALINAGGFYYYISLPVILVLVIILAVGLVYLFLMIGTIPIKLTIILFIGVVVTIFSMIKSLLVKVNYTEPGRVLKKEEAPHLYKLTDEVAQIMQTRPIDEIRITPLNDMAVYEKGTWQEKMNDKGKRILIAGTSVLNDFKTEDFKAVLAHEYGHFTHRDTAGGEIALRVQNDMHKYFVALYEAEQNTIWNVAFHFLRLYNFIFRRISHGATRLQEVLADRVAAEKFGAVAFENGLTHVIKRDIEFGKFATQEINDAVENKRPLNNLYELKVNPDASIEEELNKALNSTTTEDDTHPSPKDRFRYIAGIKAKNISNNSSLVKDLFLDWNLLTLEMTKEIQVKVGEY